MGIYDRDYMRRPPEPPSISLRTVAVVILGVAALVGGAIYYSSRDNQSVTHYRGATHATPFQPINVNIATTEQLARIPYLRSDARQAIIEHRPYGTLEDLMRVPGIKQRMLERIRPYVTVE